MKRILILLIIQTVLILVKAQDDCCFPDKDGTYTYYANLKSENLKKTLSKENLFSILKTSKAVKLKKIEIYENEIIDVFVSFPTAKTKFLQQSISIKSANPNLDIELSEYSDIFNLVEVCRPKEMLSYEPNDYALGTDWSGHLDLIRAPEAWEITKGDPRILIGITDTYIETTHEDLSDQIAQVLQNSSPNVYNSSHGVIVAGCAAAHTNNGVGLASIGFNSKIVFSSNWASDNEVLLMAQIPGVRVINCSWINNCNYNVTTDSIYKAIRDIHNVIVTAGAGNSSDHCGSLTAYVYPASYEAVISVTTVGHSYEIGSIIPGIGGHLWKDCHEKTIGNKNQTHHHNDKVDICAPGYNVICRDLNNGYTNAWGTSVSSPIVAGVCALVASVNPCLTAIEIQDIVLSTADIGIYNIPENSDYIGLLGSGRLDAYTAVKKALELGAKYIQNITYSGNVTEIAETELKAGNTTITSGSDVLFKATRDVELLPGFEVQQGAVFAAEIYESNCY